MAVFSSMEHAGQAVSDIIAAKIVPASLEFMDQTTLRCVEEYLQAGLPVHAGAVLLVEVDGNDQAAIGAETAKAAAICAQNHASEVKTAATASESAVLWAARRALSPSLARMRPNKVGEDICVPRSMIPEMVRRVQEIAAKYDLLIPIFGHAGDGNLHPNILFDRRNPEEMERVHAASGEIFAAAVALGGTLSGEHGIGLLKREFLHLGLQPEAIDLMKRLKQALDPHGIMNPGKIFAEASA
jgi:glycolate oxidase